MTRRTGLRAAPTVRDVAAAAGVSPATAARALGGYGLVGDDTRAKVVAAAAALGYRTNGLARAMTTGSSHLLALVVADIENSFFARASRGFTDQARAAGFEVIVANTDEDTEKERSIVKVLLEKRIDGLVVAPASGLAVEHLHDAETSGARVVLLDRHVQGLRMDSVLVDSRKAARCAVEHLVEHGHRRIAIVTGASPEEMLLWPSLNPTMTSTARDRIIGFQQGLHHAGLDVVPEYVKIGDFHPHAAGRMTLELMALPEPPTAIFATDSLITLGVMQALQGLDLRLPDDLSVIGMDDSEWATVIRPRLTVVTQPVYEIGKKAADRVIARVSGDESRSRRYNLPTQLVVRDSVSAPRR